MIWLHGQQKNKDQCLYFEELKLKFNIAKP